MITLALDASKRYSMSSEVSIVVPGQKVEPIRIAARWRYHHSGIRDKIVRTEGFSVVGPSKSRRNIADRVDSSLSSEKVHFRSNWSLSNHRAMASGRNACM